MVEHFVGRVAELWRYPVEIYAWESARTSCPLRLVGLWGIRAWALRETATGRIASARVSAIARISGPV